MLEDEEFAMRKHILALLAAGAAALAVAAIVPAEARPLGKGWSAGRVGAGWGKARGFHHGYRHKIKGWPVAAEPGFGGGRYLSEDAWFLSDIGGYLAHEPAYPDGWSGGFVHPVSAAPARYGDRRPVSYTVRIHGAPHGRRIVTVHRGAPGRAIRHAAFRPGRR